MHDEIGVFPLESFNIRLPEEVFTDLIKIDTAYTVVTDLLKLSYS